MFKTFLVALLVVSALGSFAVYTAIERIKEQRQEASTSALNRKKPDIVVTLVEGWRREEIAAKLDKEGVSDYNQFLRESMGKEGYLFPDTYRFFPNTPAKEVVDVLVANFQQKTGSRPPTQANLILASIIEREAQNEEDRVLISGVYTNRLKIGMKLDADPTVQYGKDSLAYPQNEDPSAFKFWTPITQAEYQTIISPYNTYLNTGLPPTPIANPGLKSIEAAQMPAPHNFLFFLYRDKKLYLSSTLEEHTSKQ